MISDLEIQKLFEEWWKDTVVITCEGSFIQGFKAAIALSEEMQAEKCCGNCRDRKCELRKHYVHANFYCCDWKKRED